MLVFFLVHNPYSSDLYGQITDTDIFKQRAGEEQEGDKEKHSSQSSEPKLVESQTTAAFVKIAPPLAPGEMFFNVLKIENKSGEI